MTGVNRLFNKRKNRVFSGGWAGIIFLLLAALYLLPVVLNPGSSIPGGFRDAYSILWQVWWYGQALDHDGSSLFFTTHHAFPRGEQYFTYQNLVFYIPGAFLSRIVGSVAATNILCLVSLALVGYGAFFFLREIHGSPSGAAAGALLAMTCSFVTVSIHSGIYYLVASAGLTFLFLFSASRARTGGRWRQWIITGLLLSMVALTSGYCLLVAVITGIFLIWGLPVKNREMKNRAITGPLLACLLAGLIMLVPYGLMLWGSGSKELSDAATFRKFTASWYHLVNRPGKTYSGAAGVDGQYLVNHVGCLVLLLALIGLFYPKTGTTKNTVIAAILALFWILVATGSIPIVTAILGRIGMRNIHRYLLGAFICLIWLAARAVAVIFSTGGRWGKTLAVLVVSAALSESLLCAGPTLPVETLNVGKTRTDDYLATLRGEAVVEMPMIYPFFSNNMRSYASQVHHGKKLVNPGTNVFSKQIITVPGEDLLWRLEHCIREGTVLPVHPQQKKEQLKQLSQSGVCAIVFNERYLARSLGLHGPARVELVKTVLKKALGEPVKVFNGCAVYLISGQTVD